MKANDSSKAVSKALLTGESWSMDIGDTVICDWCNKDWTASHESGGFLFDSHAACPDCARRALEDIKHGDEAGHIRGQCPPDLSFADWVRRLRYGNTTIMVEPLTRMKN